MCVAWSSLGLRSHSHTGRALHALGVVVPLRKHSQGWILIPLGQGHEQPCLYLAQLIHLLNDGGRGADDLYGPFQVDDQLQCFPKWGMGTSLGTRGSPNASVLPPHKAPNDTDSLVPFFNSHGPSECRMSRLKATVLLPSLQHVLTSLLHKAWGGLRLSSHLGR